MLCLGWTREYAKDGVIIPRGETFYNTIQNIMPPLAQSQVTISLENIEPELLKHTLD